MQFSNRQPRKMAGVRSSWALPVCSAMLLLGMTWMPSAAAQEAPVMIDASLCLQFETSVERLVCFEEQAKAAAGNAPANSQGNLPVLRIERSNQAAPSTPAAPAPVAERTRQAAPVSTAPAQQVEPATVVNRQDPEASFGLPEEEERGRDAGREMFGTIASFTEFSPNQYRITLTNGQVWRQMRPDRYNIKEGHTVRIYPTRWGSAYRLTVEELKGFIQVERIQ